MRGLWLCYISFQQYYKALCEVFKPKGDALLNLGIIIIIIIIQRVTEATYKPAPCGFYFSAVQSEHRLASRCPLTFHI